MNINLGLTAVATGTVDVITATYSPAPPSLYDRLILFFRASGANTSTTPTFNPNGLGAKTIVKRGGQALIAGDIPRVLYECIIIYDSANNRWELINPAGFGTNAETPCSGNDSRLSDSRAIKPLAYDHVSFTHTGDVAETLVSTHLISAGTFNANSFLQYFHQATKSGLLGAMTIRAYINTSAAIGGIQIAGLQTNNLTIYQAQTRNITFKNSLTSQEVFSPATLATVSDVTTSTTIGMTAIAIDGTINQYLVISIQNANAGDTTKMNRMDLIHSKP